MATGTNAAVRAFIALSVATLAACGGGGGASSPAPAPTTPGGSVTPAPSGGTTPQPATPQPAARGLVAGAPDVANTTLAGNQYVRSVDTLAAGGYAVTWLSQDAAGTASLFMQRYGAQGAKSGGETRIAYDLAPQENPAIAVLRDGSVVVLSVQSRSGTSTVFARRFDASGQALAGETIVATQPESPMGAGEQRYLAQPVLLALDDGGFAAGWASVVADYRGAVRGQHAQRFDAQSNAAGAPVDFAAAGIDQNLALKLVRKGGGDFIAGTTHRFNGTPYVQYRVGAAVIGALFDSNSGLPEFNTTLVALADGRLALWSMASTGGYVQMYDAAGQPAGAATRVAVGPETVVALADGGWITVVRQMPGQPSLAQRFDAAGAPIGAQVDMAPDMSRPLPVASTGSGFALAWTFAGALGDADVRVQQASAD